VQSAELSLQSKGEELKPERLTAWQQVLDHYALWFPKSWELASTYQIVDRISSARLDAQSTRTLFEDAHVLLLELYLSIETALQIIQQGRYSKDGLVPGWAGLIDEISRT
jgi:hypothetical protein